MVIYKSETRQDPTEAAGHQLSGPFGLPPRCHKEFFCVVHLSFPRISLKANNNDISQRTFKLCHSSFRQCSSCGGEHILGPLLSSRQFLENASWIARKFMKAPDFGVSLRVCPSRQAGRLTPNMELRLWHCDTVWQRQAPYRTLLQWGGEGLASHTTQRVVEGGKTHHYPTDYKTQHGQKKYRHWHNQNTKSLNQKNKNYNIDYILNLERW